MVAPVNTTLPVITGTVDVGFALSVSNGVWSNVPTSFAYAWLRNGVLIEGAISNAYTVTYADVLAKLSARVTASNVDGSSASTSAQTSAVPGSLIVETGVGFTNADSYASVTQADSYHTMRNNTLWATLSGYAKESALRRATDYLDTHYGSRWGGEEYALGQSLDWPRVWVPIRPARQTYLTGFTGYLDRTPLPVALTRATMELALKSATGTSFEPELGQTVKQETVGPLTTIYQDSARTNNSLISYPLIDELLAHLIHSFSGIRVVRG